MGVKKYVSYIVGSVLSFPVYIYHLLPSSKEDDTRKEKKAVPKKDEKFLSQTANTKNLSTQSKRTCGHSQKNVRVDHKKH